MLALLGYCYTVQVTVTTPVENFDGQLICIELRQNCDNVYSGRLTLYESFCRHSTWVRLLSELFVCTAKKVRNYRVQCKGVSTGVSEGKAGFPRPSSLCLK